LSCCFLSAFCFSFSFQPNQTASRTGPHLMIRETSRTRPAAGYWIRVATERNDRAMPHDHGPKQPMSLASGISAEILGSSRITIPMARNSPPEQRGKLKKAYSEQPVSGRIHLSARPASSFDFFHAAATAPALPCPRDVAPSRICAQQPTTSEFQRNDAVAAILPQPLQIGRMCL